MGMSSLAVMGNSLLLQHCTVPSQSMAGSTAQRPAAAPSPAKNLVSTV